jgi:predicted ATP-binding protein involved in virulence
MLLSDRRRGQGLVSLFARLVNDIFDRDVTVALSTSKYFSQADEIAEGDPNPLRFEVMGKDRVGAMDLPDGFRSSAAWLADLCAAWFEQQPDPTAEVDPKSIEAIVLIDEIDLHLHPTLQRALVPRLRKALPKVQWVVTTHSPLVLANFDANEIIALDRNEEGHIRPLDRQIMGFSTDQIYEWLMGTRPTGVAIEEITMRADQGKADRDRLAALLRTSPDVDEEKARKQVSDFNELLRSFKH